jgi:hypothetical protein
VTDAGHEFSWAYLSRWARVPRLGLQAEQMARFPAYWWQRRQARPLRFLSCFRLTLSYSSPLVLKMRALFSANLRNPPSQAAMSR